MSDFVCPNCRGAFPVSVVHADLENDAKPMCPWCGENLTLTGLAFVKD